MLPLHINELLAPYLNNNTKRFENPAVVFCFVLDKCMVVKMFGFITQVLAREVN